MCFALAPLRAQEAPKKAPGPAPSPSEAVLESWNDIGRKLIAMASDFPEDKFSYKPQAESRTFIAIVVQRFGVHVLFHGYRRWQEAPQNGLRR